MAIYSEEMIYGMNVALEEATILGVEFVREEEAIAVTFAPIALDANKEIPTDNRVQFIFKKVGRFIASYRLGDWNDENAPIMKFEPEQILEKVEEFGHCPIYGWDFIDNKKEGNYSWLNKLSFDFNATGDQGRAHNIELFQAGQNKHIDIKIWFDEFEIYTPNHDIVEVQTFIENGKRAWDGIYDGTASGLFCIYPSKDYKFPQETKNAVKNSGTITEGQKKQNTFTKFWKGLWS